MSRCTIGIFDSGVGGLTVFKALKKVLPFAKYVYLADTAYLPYGSKTPEEIKDRALWGISWLEHYQVDVIVMACHTASSVLVCNDLSPRVFTTVSSCAKSIMSQEIRQGVGLIATPLTVHQDAIPRALRAKGFSKPIHSLGCPDLVPIIEHQEWHKLGPCLSLIETFFEKNPVDMIYYGCTHYPMMTPFLPLTLSSHLKDPALFLAQEVALYLSSSGNSGTPPIPSSEFYCTGPHETLKNHLRDLGVLSTISLINQDLPNEAVAF